jgi:asparagine synthase (glutamine-hydrolysing)
LRADVPVCFHLSGGLDSGAVASLAARHGRPRCFTVGFDQPDYDELAFAEEAATYLGADWSPVPLSQRQLVDALPDAVHMSEGLAINGHLAAKFLLSRAIRQAGFKVVLSGEGSDEILGGYVHLRKDHLQHGEGAAVDSHALQELTASSAMLAGMHLAEGESLPADVLREALGYVPSFLEAKGSLGWRMRRLLDAGFVSRCGARDPFRSFLDCFDVPGQLAGRAPLDVSSYLWTKSSLATYILRTLGDGTEMAHGVEGRLPFLDHVFFEFARSVPAELKIRGTTEKFILREALRGLLPEAMIERRKHPFTAPPWSRFGGPAFDRHLQDVVRSRNFAEIPFFDVPRVLDLLERLPKMPERDRTAADPVLMLVLTAAHLQQRFRLR